jgi:NAD(P)H-hydrate epimerase
MEPEWKDRAFIKSREMRSFEINADYYNISLLQLMENAGRSVAAEVVARFPRSKRVAIFCGLGGNGGDGFVAARHLAGMGYSVSVIIAGKAKDITHEAAFKNWQSLQFLRRSVHLFEVTDGSTIPQADADVIVDALLGTGAKGKLRPPISQIVERINLLSAFKIAVDSPTGVDSDTGEAAANAVKADLTLTFYKAKIGLENAKKHTGELLVKDIGLPEELEKYAGPGDVLMVKKPRPEGAHKGDFGRLLVVGGSEVFSGAPTLVALAAMRTGVDITYLAAPVKTAQTISSISPDLITVKLEGKHLNVRNVAALKVYVEEADAVVLGPGLGLHSETVDFVRNFIELVEIAGKPLLLDADGLKGFAQFKRPLKVPVVLTPHAGEFVILTGKKLPESLEDRIIAVKKAADALGAVILLKGQTDIVSDGKRVKLNFTGNPGMTVGGTGDLLSGIVGAFLAQKIDPFEAAVAGAFVNGAAGDFTADKIGYHMVASDLLKWIPRVLDNPISHLKVRKDWWKNA